MNPKRYLVIGGPGTGKTTLIKTLKDLGYPIFEEAARLTITKNLRKKNNILPWTDRDAFDQQIMELMLDDYRKASQFEISFFDGGLLDIIAWRKYLKKGTNKFDHFLNSYPYEKIAFSPTPWEELYYSDKIRPMDFQSARRINSSIIKYYRSIDFTVHKLAKQTPIQRARKVLRVINSL